MHTNSQTLMDFTTQRLYIRPVQIEDKDAMFRYRSEPETSQFLSMVPESADDIAAMILKTPSEIDIQGTWFQFAVLEQATNTFIGDIGVHFLTTDTENKQVEIGYTLDKNFRGKGYATEALTWLIDFLFTDLNKHRIIASVDPINTPSMKLLERLKFRKEAHFVKSLYFQDRWVDDVIYAMLKEDWETRAL